MKKIEIAMNNLALRHTPSSKFSHFGGTFDQLVRLVEENFDKATRGYKEGVLLVPLPAEGFFSGVVEVNDGTTLKASFEARRRGESPYVQVVAVGASKLPAAMVEVVLYSHEVLVATKENTTEALFEIISINARPTAEPEPQTPVAMARNMLGMAGGSSATYTAEEFAKSIIYWSTRVMAG